MQAASDDSLNNWLSHGLLEAHWLLIAGLDGDLHLSLRLLVARLGEALRLGVGLLVSWLDHWLLISCWLSVPGLRLDLHLNARLLISWLRLHVNLGAWLLVGRLRLDLHLNARLLIPWLRVRLLEAGLDHWLLHNNSGLCHRCAMMEENDFAQLETFGAVAIVKVKSNLLGVTVDLRERDRMPHSKAEM